MKMLAGVFLGSANGPYLRGVLEKFSEGIKKHGDSVFLEEGAYRDCDVAIIFGSWKPYNMEHHIIKNDIIKKCKKFIVIETPLLGRKKVKEVCDDEWFRVGINGFLADTGNFNNKNMPDDRWSLIKKELNLQVQPWKKNGAHILLALQIPGDASLKGENISKWAYESCSTIRDASDRAIIIRTPQLDRKYDKKYMSLINEHIPNVFLQTGTKENLQPTLDQCFASVTFTSGLGIESIVSGIPNFSTNPGSFTHALGNEKLSLIETPSYPNRDQWLADLSYAQWNIQEMMEGLPWAHLKPALSEEHAKNDKTKHIYTR
jgi:hypothetical protein